jgi:hypothetical protein
MLKDGRFRRSCFVFREDGHAAQRFPIPPEVIEGELISQRQFHLPKLTVYLTGMHAMVHGAMQLQTGQEYPLSGFPKQLVLEKNTRPGSSVMLRERPFEIANRLLMVV